MGDAQGGVAHLAGLLTEDGAQEALFGGQLGLALRGDLTDEDVAGGDLGADADDAALVQVSEGSSETLGISRVISSSPSLVSRASTSYSSMWIEVRMSSSTTRRLRIMASS